MSSPENSAAAILATLPLLIRIAAAHFSNPDRALEFALWCEKEAGAQGVTNAPAGVEDRKESAGRAGISSGRPARPPRRERARCSVAFNRDPWNAWR